MAASGALQALLDQFSHWTPGSGVKQLPAWQPNMDDPSAAMFGFGAPHVWWAPSPPPPTMSTTLPVDGGGGQSGDQGLPRVDGADAAGGNYAGPTATSGGIPGAGGLGNGYGIGNGFGGSGSAPGSWNNSGGSGMAGNDPSSSSYLDGLAAANGLDSTGSSWSNYMPSTSTIGGILGGLLGGPLGAIGGSLVGKAVGPSRLEQSMDGAMNQGAMGVSIDSSSGGTPFTPDGSDPGGSHPDDLHDFGSGNGGAYGGQSGSSVSYDSAGGGGGGSGGGSGWSEGGGHDFGGGQYGQVVDMSGGMDVYRAPKMSMASGGSVAAAAGGRAFGRFMAGPMQSDPRTAQFAADLKQAMAELAVALKGDPQAAKVRHFFQANYVEPVEEALRKKDAEGAMRLCVAMMNEAKRIAQGERA